MKYSWWFLFCIAHFVELLDLLAFWRLNHIFESNLIILAHRTSLLTKKVKEILQFFAENLKDLKVVDSKVPEGDEGEAEEETEGSAKVCHQKEIKFYNSFKFYNLFKF